mmetsp:Transcript_18461/g.30602  ORF Transcript_18461/g.30602 Transcript_18461/m.30602 type:complete len:213 (-) Transcript_18461:635-1273(-)
MIMNRFLATGIDRVVNFHNRSLIATSVAVIGSRKDSHHRFVVLPLVAFHHQLMGTGNKMKSVNVGKLFRNVLSEGVTGTTRRNTPTAAIIRITPNQITHWSLMRHFLHSVQVSGVIQGIDTGRQASVKTKDAICHDRRHWKVVKGIREVLPNIGIAVLAKAFVVKSINLSNLTTLVVSPQNGDSIAVPDLQRHEERHRFQTIVTSINVISHE